MVKIRYFPFDRQYCMVRFGSWIYSHSLVDYEVRKDVASVDMSSFTKNSEWELLAMRLEKSVVSRTRGHDLHPHLTAVIYLKRNTFFYLFNIIVPCCMLSVLTLMTFWLPPTSCEKVTLGLNVFLAFSMFMLLIAEEVPASSDAVPLIGIYLCVVMTMTSMSVLCAVLVTNLHNRGSKLKAAPRWLARLFIRHLAGPMRVSKDVHLLASTIYLPEHSQFFFLHDARWTSKYQRVRTHSGSSSDELSSSPKARQAGHSQRENTEEKTQTKDKGRMKSESHSTGSHSDVKGQARTPRPRALHPSDQRQVSYGLTGSWERVTHEADYSSKREDLDDPEASSITSMQRFEAHKGKRNSRTGRPEMLQLINTAQNRLPKSSISSCPEAQRLEELTTKTKPTSSKYSSPPGSNGETSEVAKLDERALYQETSLCGGGVAPCSSLEQSQLSGSASQGGVLQVSTYTPSLSYQSQCARSPGVKSSPMIQQSSCSPLSPIDSGSEGTFHQLSPFPASSRPRASSLDCEATPSIPSYHANCDDDTESEVWVLRDDFQGSSSAETLAETGDISSAKLYSRRPHTKPSPLVPQSMPSPQYHSSSAPAGYRLSSKPGHLVGPSDRKSSHVLKRARIMIAEWCIIAKVMDRVLFILCLIATLFAYIFILIVVPLEFGSKSGNVTFVDTVNTGRYTWQQS